MCEKLMKTRQTQSDGFPTKGGSSKEEPPKPQPVKVEEKKEVKEEKKDAKKDNKKGAKVE